MQEGDVIGQVAVVIGDKVRVAEHLPDWIACAGYVCTSADRETSRGRDVEVRPERNK